MAIRKITDDLYYVGATDPRRGKFENMFLLPNGMAYNSYLLIDDKTVLFDTVDVSVGDVFLSNVREALAGRKLNYLFIHHMEPDHSDKIQDILSLYPDVRIVISAIGLKILSAYMNRDMTDKCIIENSQMTFDTGHHALSFIQAPLVHWPEVFFTYDRTARILFSADAFGTFGGNNGYLFSDEAKLDDFFFSEMRRYYANVVGKFGPHVLKALAQACSRPIDLICSLHGPIWKTEFEHILSLYRTWASYIPEKNDAAVFCGSIYGNTLKACERLQGILSGLGISVRVFDAANTELSYLVSEAFRVRTLVIASSTYSGDIFPPIKCFLESLGHIGLPMRTYAIIQNGSWAPASGLKIKQIAEGFKDSHVIDPVFTIKGKYDEKTQEGDLTALAVKIKESLEGK